MSQKHVADIINPEPLKYRLEQNEKFIDKEKSIELREIQQKLSRGMETKLRKSHDASMMLFKAVDTLLSAFSAAMYQLPHDRRKSIINEMPAGFKEIFQAQLPQYEEHDRK